MSEFLKYLLEVSICLGLSLWIYRVLLSDLTFFAWNRAILLGMLVFAFVIPLMSFEGTAFNQAVMGEVILPVFQVGESSPQAVNAWTWQEVLLILYFAGAAFMYLRLYLGYKMSQKLVDQSSLTRFSGQWVAIHPKFIPASFFEYILMPEYNPEDPQQNQILTHESVHVRLGHSWDLALLSLAKIVLWFNPLIYLYEKSLREVHEYQADEKVTQRVSRKEYATLLLDLITRPSSWQLANNFNQFQTKKRIIMLAKSNSTPKQKVRFFALIPAIALLVGVFSCEITPQDEIDGPTMMGKQNTAMGPSNAMARISSLAKDGGEVFDVVETPPKPPGGMAGWNQYLSQNLQYPAEARQLGIEGTVIVVFVINSDGSISDVEILRGIGGGADEEAVRVVQNAPNWEPGKQRDRTVNTRMRLPIRFKLGDGNPTSISVTNEFPEVIEVPVGSDK